MWFNVYEVLLFIKVALNESFDARRYTCCKCRIRHRLHEIGAEGYPCNLPVWHLFTWSGRIRWIAVTSTTTSGLNHSGRATRNANRVYHYDLADIGLPITLGIDSDVFTVQYPRFMSIRIDHLKREQSSVNFDACLEGNVWKRFISKLFTQLI